MCIRDSFNTDGLAAFTGFAASTAVFAALALTSVAGVIGALASFDAVFFPGAALSLIHISEPTRPY
mgnify:CR=1 FL=1